MMSVPRGPRWRAVAAVSAVLLAVLAVTARYVVPSGGFVAVALAAGSLAALVAGTPPTPRRMMAAVLVLVLIGARAQSHFYGFKPGRQDGVITLQAPAIVFLGYFGALAELHAVRGKGPRVLKARRDEETSPRGARGQWGDRQAARGMRESIADRARPA